MSRVIVVVLDRARARFFDVSPGGATELPCLRSPSTRGGKFHSDRQDSPGSGERRYHGRVLEEERRHLGAVVDYLKRLGRDPSMEFVLAAPAEMTAAIGRLLPPTLRSRVIGVARVDPRRMTVARAALIARRQLESWAQLLPS